MLIRVNRREHTPQGPLADALGRPLSAREGLTEHTVVAYWPQLDHYTLDDEQETWTTVQWAEHLEAPLHEHRFATGPGGDRHAIFHLAAEISAGERSLTSPEWSEIAHRLARTVHLHIPGEEDGCRWVAVQARPRRLDILANLIRQDGTWQRQPHDLARRLAAESRRIETDLQLTRHHQHHHSAHRLAAPALAPDLPSAAPQIATLLTQLAEENEGALATARGFVEQAAYRLEGLPEPAGAHVAHRLKWIARRIHGIQQDIDAAATHLAHDRRTPFASPHSLHTTPPPLHTPHRTRPAP